MSVVVVDIDAQAAIIITRCSAMAEGPRDALSVEILQLQNIPFENESRAYRVALFSRFHTIPECDRHTHTDGQTHDDGIYRA